MTKSPNPKTFMLLAIGALFVGGALTYFAYGNMGNQEANLAKLKADSKDSKTLQQDLEQSKVELNDSTVKMQHLEQSVPEFAYVPTMLQELEKVGKNSGIEVIGVRPMPTPVVAKKEDEGSSSSRRKPFQALDIEVKGRGKYRSVMNFIDAMSTFPKIVSARTVELTPKSDPDSNETLLEVTIQLRAFVFSPPAGAPGNVRTAMSEGGNHAG